MAGSRIPYVEGRATQPAALERVAAHLAARLAVLGSEGGALASCSRPVFVGIGASYAALALPLEMLASGGVLARREMAGEIGSGIEFTGADLVIGVSQSGRSPETIDALALVPRERRAAVVNVVPSRLGDSVAHRLDLGDEPDSYASTIGYTATLMALAMMARTMLGRPAGEVAAEWSGIGPALVRHETALAPVVDQVARLAENVVAADVVASGAARSASESGALLLREVCRVPSSALVTRNYLHGEMESAGGTLHVVVGDGREVELARSLAGAGHLTLCVTSAAVDPGGHLHVVPIPGDAPLPVRTLLQTLVMQRLAGSMAEVRGVEIEDFVFDNTDTKIEEPVG
ncbi:SIS domain-containing protein [Sphaerisporangium perillae]|uniref:SIS domain-containing protein n=1 Tax=Sphaerisporangium perillae TaxID=2935860 RepID=UPI00200FB682|nr:SIS domain-containing protein [Sphaerisporangium perillae]